MVKNSNRALYLAGGLILFWSLFLLVPSGGALLGHYATTNTLLDVLTGICIVLLLQREVRYKLYAGGVLLCCAFFSALSYGKLQLLQRAQDFDLEKIFRMPTFFSDFSSLLLNGVFVAIAVLALGYFIQSEEHKKFKQVVWITAGALFVYYCIKTVVTTPGFRPMGIPEIVIRNGVACALTALAALYTNLLCTIKTKKGISLTTGAKIWVSICMAFTTISFIITISSIEWFDLLTVCVPILGLTGLILLLCKKRIGFLLTVFAVGFSIANGVSYAVGFLFYGKSIMEGLIMLITSLASSLNPVITWLFICKSWQEDGESQKDVPTNSIMNGEGS